MSATSTIQTAKCRCRSGGLTWETADAPYCHPGCTHVWEPVPETLPDSGARTEFTTGAVRDAVNMMGVPGCKCVVCGCLSEEASDSRCPALNDNSEHIWMVLTPVLPNQSAKADAGKPRIDLIPATAELRVGEVLRFGAEKYAEDSWKGVPEAQRRYLAAARRHINAHQRGERLDTESGLPHLAHAACNIMFVLELCEAENPCP